jgi:DNA-binding MarR family transcriptional regulator
VPKAKTQLSGSEDISITLTATQVDAVRRAPGGRNATVADLLLRDQSEAGELARETRKALNEALDDPRLSQSVLRALSILTLYGPDREWQPITGLAATLEMSPSTAHRYVRTLRAVGLMEQDPDTREYRPVRH